MSGIIQVGGGGGTAEGDIVFTTYTGEILFKTTAGEVLRMRIPNSGTPTVEISGDLNLTAGSTYKINGAAILQERDTFVDNEVPGGAIDNANTLFTLASTPILGSVSLYQNGVLQRAGLGHDYTISGSTITFIVAPQSGSQLLANYRI